MGANLTLLRRFWKQIMRLPRLLETGLAVNVGLENCKVQYFVEFMYGRIGRNAAVFVLVGLKL
jgi:hypothetical protein